MKLQEPIRPSKIVCVGRNYREHAAELGNKMPDEPLLFLKAPSAIIYSGDEIVLPSASRMSSSVGCGLRRSKPADAMMNPGVQ